MIKTGKIWKSKIGRLAILLLLGFIFFAIFSPSWARICDSALPFLILDGFTSTHWTWRYRPRRFRYKDSPSCRKGDRVRSTTMTLSFSMLPPACVQQAPIQLNCILIQKWLVCFSLLSLLVISMTAIANPVLSQAQDSAETPEYDEVIVYLEEKIDTIGVRFTENYYPLNFWVHFV